MKERERENKSVIKRRDRKRKTPIELEGECGTYVSAIIRESERGQLLEVVLSRPLMW